MLDVTLNVAHALLDHAYVYDRDMHATARRGEHHFGQFHDILADMLLVNCTAAAATRKSKAESDRPVVPPAASLPPIAVQIDLAVSIVDEAADQISFICQVLERYLRCVTACLTGESLQHSSRLSDDLSVRLHETQGHYVLLERGYIVTSVRHAIFAPSGWLPVGVHEDESVLSYAWCDHVFFLFSKAAARSAATCADIAAAATINYIAVCFEDSVKPAMKDCVVRCGHMKIHASASVSLLRRMLRGEDGGGGGASESGASRSNGASATTTHAAASSSADDLDDELEASLRTAILGPSATAESKKKAAKAEFVEEDLSHFTASFATDEAILALNTIITVQSFSASLVTRYVCEVDGMPGVHLPCCSYGSAT